MGWSSSLHVSTATSAAVRSHAQGLRLTQDSVQAEVPVHVSEAWNHHDLLRGTPSNCMASQQPGVFLCFLSSKSAQNFGSKQSKLDMRDVQINPDQAPYGSTHRHVIAPVQQVAQYFEEGTFDAVGCLPSMPRSTDLLLSRRMVVTIIMLHKLPCWNIRT